jgi:hypothetical protein
MKDGGCNDNFKEKYNPYDSIYYKEPIDTPAPII